MYWTNWVRGVCSILLALNILCSIIIGVGVMFLAEIGGGFFVFLGFVVIGAGFIGAITLNSVVMMFSEISINVFNMRKNAASTEQISAPNSNIKTNDETNANQDSTDSWVCRCGCHNTGEAKYCRSCGKQYTSVTLQQNQTSPNTTSWVCLKCGHRNPNSKRKCAYCGRSKIFNN